MVIKKLNNSEQKSKLQVFLYVLARNLLWELGNGQIANGRIFAICILKFDCSKFQISDRKIRLISILFFRRYKMASKLKKTFGKTRKYGTPM